MTSTSERIVAYARQQLGDPYVWGAEGPDGFDCSGLVYAAYKAAGLNVQRTTASVLGRQGTAVGVQSATPGDIVYYDKPGTVDHVGIYIGNGQMINAPTQGQPVAIANIGTPTSIRHLPEVSTGTGSILDGDPDAPWNRDPGSLGPANPLDAAVTGIGAAFLNWQNDAVSIGVKILAAGSAAALVIVGARQAIQNSKE